jgi:hypothetical protein
MQSARNNVGTRDTSFNTCACYKFYKNIKWYVTRQIVSLLKSLV